jgi:hypocretin (orexin) receptor 2
VCVVVWRSQQMHTVTNCFIVNLSLADLMVILVCLPPSVIEDVAETWFAGSIMCKLVKYVQVDLLYTNSVFNSISFQLLS